MRSKGLPIIFALILVILIAIGVFYSQKNKLAENSAPGADATALASPSVSPTTSPSPSPSLSVSPSPSTLASPAAVDLSTDANGLSKATVFMNTTEGLIKIKFYSKDAPNTVNRLVQLIQSGFYNGLTFHRVVPGFVVQGGDPRGDGTGGSGVKLKAEFNDRHHLEGTVAMARAADPDSADSQFYICLAPQPELDHKYTVVGQVIDGMDVVRKIHVGDKMTSVTIQ